MPVTSSQKRESRAVILLLLPVIVTDNIILSRFFPWPSDLIRLDPLPVLFGVPVSIPVSFGLIPVFLLFAFFYYLVICPYRHLGNPLCKELARKKMRMVLTGIAAVPLFTLCAGLLYFLIRDNLPRALRNGIEAWGMNVDLHLLYPGTETIHFRGSMFILSGFLLGIYVWHKKIKAASAIVVVPAVNKEKIISGNTVANMPQPAAVSAYPVLETVHD